MIFCDTETKAWFGHTPHLTRGFSHTPCTHSFEQAGAYPFLPVLALDQSRGKTSSRPRKRLRKSDTFSAAVSSADVKSVAPAVNAARSSGASRSAAIRCSSSLCSRRSSQSLLSASASSPAAARSSRTVMALWRAPTPVSRVKPLDVWFDSGYQPNPLDLEQDAERPD